MRIESTGEIKVDKATKALMFGIYPTGSAEGKSVVRRIPRQREHVSTSKAMINLLSCKGECDEMSAVIIKLVLI